MITADTTATANLIKGSVQTDEEKMRELQTQLQHLEESRSTKLRELKSVETYGHSADASVAAGAPQRTNVDVARYDLSVPDMQTGSSHDPLAQTPVRLAPGVLGHHFDHRKHEGLAPSIDQIGMHATASPYVRPEGEPTPQPPAGNRAAIAPVPSPPREDPVAVSRDEVVGSVCVFVWRGRGACGGRKAGRLEGWKASGKADASRYRLSSPSRAVTRAVCRLSVNWPCPPGSGLTRSFRLRPRALSPRVPFAFRLQDQWRPPGRPDLGKILRLEVARPQLDSGRPAARWLLTHGVHFRLGTPSPGSSRGPYDLLRPTNDNRAQTEPHFSNSSPVPTQHASAISKGIIPFPPPPPPPPTLSVLPGPSLRRAVAW